VIQGVTRGEGGSGLERVQKEGVSGVKSQMSNFYGLRIKGCVARKKMRRGGATNNADVSTELGMGCALLHTR